jgi:hypothetical protein
MVSKPERLVSLHFQDLLQVGLELELSSNPAKMAYRSAVEKAHDMPNGRSQRWLSALSACGLGPECPVVLVANPAAYAAAR